MKSKRYFVWQEISIHALREEGDECRRNGAYQLRISIHALREEGDLVCGILGVLNPHISIHALREEGDGSLLRVISKFLIFLSTPSARRATSFSSSPCTLGMVFLSTPSARRAT